LKNSISGKSSGVYSPEGDSFTFNPWTELKQSRWLDNPKGLYSKERRFGCVKNLNLLERSKNV
jgi:hypothetical protein